MPYRPDHASFSLNTGSAIAAVLPASGLAAAIGSFCVVAFFAASGLVSGSDPGPWPLASTALGFVLFMAGGMLVGTALCAFYIGVIGVPIAALLGERIHQPYSIAVSLATALATSYLAATVIAGDFLTWDSRDKWEMIGLMLAYSIPAGLFFRKFIISERSLSPWAG